MDNSGNGEECACTSSPFVMGYAAVKAAVNNIGKTVLQDHINHCIVNAVETGDTKVLQDLSAAIDKFVK